VDDALLERIVREHLVGGRPVEEAIFHRLDEESR
jgi:(2Fe-2S) ferredoxin